MWLMGLSLQYLVTLVHMLSLPFPLCTKGGREGGRDDGEVFMIDIQCTCTYMQIN